ncbi:unnamed protein product [Caenorhabditis brenneri]
MNYRRRKFRKPSVSQPSRKGLLNRQTLQNTRIEMTKTQLSKRPTEYAGTPVAASSSDSDTLAQTVQEI